jgi:hypothetical protein
MKRAYVYNAKNGLVTINGMLYRVDVPENCEIKLGQTRYFEVPDNSKESAQLALDLFFQKEA